MGYLKGKQVKKDIILVAFGYYCRFSLRYRDVSEIQTERGVSIHPTTIVRWVHEYGNLMYPIWKKKNKSTHFVWHLDETYIKLFAMLHVHEKESKRFMLYTNKRKVIFRTSLFRRTRNYSNDSEFLTS